jgi:GntR family transcriptional repressor for pyruvate dehydrogenase complex
MNIGAINPIKAKKAYLQIVETIIELVIQGKLLYGSKLYNEQELMQLLGVSRPTLREALRVMEFIGMATISPRRGIIINQPQVSGGYLPLLYILMFEKTGERELFELRQALQIEMAGLAAQRRSEESLASLWEIVMRTKQNMNAGADEFSQLDYDFHQQVIYCAQNAMALKLMNTVGVLIREQLREIIRQMPTEKRADTLRYHTSIAGYITKGDAKSAQEEMRQHLFRPYQSLSDKPVKFSFTGDVPQQ